MKVESVTEELVRVAKRMVWFEEPEEALRSPDFFLAHVMTYGTVQDVVTAEKYFTQDDFRHALENAPPGVFNARSWAYWNTMFNRVPVPEMPRRHIPGSKERGVSADRKGTKRTKKKSLSTET